MKLFDSKKEPAVSPEIVECDRRMAELAQRKQAIYTHIGELYVKENGPDKVAGTPYESDVCELGNIERGMQELDRRKLALQGLRRCEKCGNILVLDSAFCNKCGVKLEAVKEEKTPATDSKKCINCGCELDKDAMFCSNCGTKQE